MLSTKIDKHSIFLKNGKLCIVSGKRQHQKSKNQLLATYETNFDSLICRTPPIWRTRLAAGSKDYNSFILFRSLNRLTRSNKMRAKVRPFSSNL